MGEIEPLFASLPRVADRNELEPRRAYPDVEVVQDGALKEARAGRNVAWLVACVMIVVCAAQAAAIALMLPLKEVVPYTVLVDRQTGYVETARGVQLGALAEDRAIVESMLAQYVLARETFDPADFSERYGRVALWSLGAAREGYVAQYQADAPGNILAELRPGTTVRITVKRIDLLTNETARVRFEAIRQGSGGLPVRSDWQSVISFRFTGAPMRNADRLLNPLGFQVTGYRRDLETALEPSPSLSSSTPAPTVATEAIKTAPAETSLAPATVMPRATDGPTPEGGLPP
jgi:type IV secretion system protein VirB8